MLPFSIAYLFALSVWLADQMIQEEDAGERVRVKLVARGWQVPLLWLRHLEVTLVLIASLWWVLFMGGDVR